MSGDARRLVQACFDSLDDARDLLRREPALIFARTGLGETPLHYLAVENQLEAVKLLVEHGAELNTLNEFGDSALAEAASLGYAELVAWMMSHGALLTVPGQSDPTLNEAARGGSAEIVKLLLAAGADVNQEDSLGQAPMHVAAESDKGREVLAALLEAGADMDRPGLFGESPLDCALHADAMACAEFLISRGAKRLNPLDSDKPLH
jgi:ankyrin repeat protein